MSGPLRLKKQEAFAQEFVACGVASQAYRKCYSTKNMKDKTVWEASSRLLKNSKVAARIKELQERHAKRHDINIDSITAMLREDRDLAHDIKQPSAAVAAAMGMAKIHGLIIDKVKTTVKRDADDLTDAELAAIATGRSTGTAETQGGPEDPDRVH